MPPPPTNILDVTQPPDTQLANLLGLDLRNLALNIQQRMSFISGTTTQMWNPGADAQPTNWQGLLFFATDTGKIWQWSGSAWVDVTADFIQAVSNVPVIVATINLVGQTSGLPTTVLYTVPVGKAGIYRFSADLFTTLASGTGSFQPQIIWNNGFGADNLYSGFGTAQAAALGGSSSNQGNQPTFYAGVGTTIRYYVSAASITGSPQYSLSIRLEYLG